MRKVTRLASVGALSAGLVGVGMGAASAATVVGTPLVSATQVVSKDCQKTTAKVTASVRGVTNDKGGKDHVQYQLWDDGVMKASYDLWVTVGQTVKPTVVMEFSGLYATGRTGVGIYLIDTENKKTLVSKDPFVPSNTTGSCTPTAPPTATVEPTSTPTTSTTTTTKPTTTTSTTSTTKPTGTVTGPPVVTDGGQPPSNDNGRLLLGGGAALSLFAGLAFVLGRRLT